MEKQEKDKKERKHEYIELLDKYDRLLKEMAGLNRELSRENEELKEAIASQEGTLMSYHKLCKGYEALVRKQNAQLEAVKGKMEEKLSLEIFYEAVREIL